MKNLISFSEFKNTNSETSFYKIPKRIIEPQKNDKMYFFVEDEINKNVNWGFNLKNQELKNKNKSDR